MIRQYQIQIRCNRLKAIGFFKDSKSVFIIMLYLINLDNI